MSTQYNNVPISIAEKCSFYCNRNVLIGYKKQQRKKKTLL